MNAKALTLALLSLTLSSCVKSSVYSSDQDSATPSSIQDSGQSEARLVKKVEAKFYLSPSSSGLLDEENALSLPTSFFDVALDVPYVSLSSFLNGVYTPLLGNGQTLFTYKEKTLINEINKASMRFDVNENEISCPDLDLFLSSLDGGLLHEDLLLAKTNPNAKLDESKSYRRAGKKMVWKLDRYCMKLVAYEDEVYLPYALLQAIFLSKAGVGMAFNGENYFNSNFMAMIADPLTQSLNEYGKAYYGGPLGKANYPSRSEGYARYFYGTFLFVMENFYGKLSELGIEDLDAYLETSGYKEELLSSDAVKADGALAQLMNTVFCDGGHSAYTGSGVDSGFDLLRDMGLISALMNTDERMSASEKVRAELKEKRGSEAKTIEKSGETALIHLDKFSLKTNEVGMPVFPSKESVTSDETSTFALLYNAFKEIEKDEAIKNVVLDVSLNGGGAVCALGEALGFLTNDEVSFSTYNPVTGAKNVESVRYDTDLDGDFEDDDSYEGVYDFYILTSLASFSSANAFPCLASDYDYATIIGQRSGGGDCAIAYAEGSDGSSWQISSTSSIRHKDFTSVDSGAQVDLEIDYANFYDVSYLDTYLTKAKQSV